MTEKDAQVRIRKNLVLLTMGTLVSRISGFLREIFTSFYFGTSTAMDAFVIAFTIPALFRKILGEEMVERGFMPEFKSLIIKGEKNKAWETASACFHYFIFGLIIAMIFLYIFSKKIILLIAPGMDNEVINIATTMTYVIIPFMLLIGIAAFVGGLLNFLELNLVYSLAPALVSVGSVLGLVCFYPLIGYLALPLGFLIGALLQFFAQIPVIFSSKNKKKFGVTYRKSIKLESSSSFKILRESFFIFLQSIQLKSVEIVDKLLASFLLKGSISALWFSQRLLQLPISLIGFTISRSITPYLTEMNARNETDLFKRGILVGFRYTFLFTLPIAGLSIILRLPIVQLVFERGKFDCTSSYLTALSFCCYSLGLPGIGLTTILIRAFSAIQKNKIPLLVSFATMLLNILLNIILVKTPLKHGGIALASSISMTLNAFLLFLCLLFYLRERSLTVKIKEFIIPIFHIGTAFLIMILSSYGILQILSNFSLQINNPENTVLQKILILGIPGITGIFLYIGFLILFPIEETKFVKIWIRKILKNNYFLS